MRRQITALMLVLLILCGMSLSVFAQETPDGIQSGTISLTTAPGGEVTIYRVGDIRADDGDYSFVLTGDYAKYTVTEANIQSAALAEDLAEIAKKDTKGVKATADANGKVSFEVDAGLYLVVQTKAGKTGGLFNPFLISMPNYEDGAYTDQVDATPKVSVEPDEQDKPTKPTTPTKKPSKTDTKLPQTGQLNWPVPVLACSGLLLLIVGIGLRRRKETQ